METLTLEPIDAEKDIRIVEILPGIKDEAVRGQIHVIRNIGSASSKATYQPYEALSYAWGDASDQECVTCLDATGQPVGSISVPRSLFIALQHLRHPTESRYVWADSICINQADHAEKAPQVARMYDIFAHASKVIMWIGPEDEETRDSLTALERFCAIIKSGPESDSAKDIIALCSSILYRGASFLQLNPELMLGKDPNWKAIAALIARPYFSRLWVLQETIAAADRAVLQLGPRQTDWGLVREIAEQLTVTYYNIKYIFSAVSSVPGVRRYMRNFILLAGGFKQELSIGKKFDNSNRTHLLSVLLTTTNFECTDPRDELFAILRLVPGGDILDSKAGQLLAPDYTASESEIFHRLAIYLVVKNGEYDYLVFARAALGPIPAVYDDYVDGEMLNISEKARVRSTAPSWVPMKLTRDMDTMYYFHSLARKRKGMIRASNAGGHPDQADQQPALSRDRRTLSLLGRLVDRVDRLSTQSSHDITTHRKPSLTFAEAESDELDRDARRCLEVALQETWGGEGWKIILYSPIFRSLLNWMLLNNSTNERPYLDILDERDLPIFCQKYQEYLRNDFVIPDDEPVFFTSIRTSTTAAMLEHPTPGNSWLKPYFAATSKRVLNTLSGKKICQTVDGKIGLVPWNAKSGDIFAVINRACAPLLLRRVDGVGDARESVGTEDVMGQGGRYIVVGECFLDGVMMGEALNSRDWPCRRVNLV